MRAARNMDDEVGRVLADDLCTGCGACCQLDDGLSMVIDDAGFARPQRTRASEKSPGAQQQDARIFRATCPGLTLEIDTTPGTVRHPMVGQYISAWSGWAVDPHIRFDGSSGGLLTAIMGWLAETGIECVSAAPAQPDPRRAVSVSITSKEEALRSAGSRYAPVSNAGHPSADGRDRAVVGKPCEAAALRQLGRARGAPAPLLLSFFCAGTPSQAATDDLLESLGVDDSNPLTDLWYRGRGWPGRFTATTASGVRSMSYEESWGEKLGPAVQWRCKICPDGVGEFSDITAADFWNADSRGYPIFEEQGGRSALIVRTPRGRAVVEAAVAAGVIELQPMDVDDLVAIQPFQQLRRSTVVGRTLGSRLAGRSVPRYRGFGLWAIARGNLRANVSALRGTFGRVRRLRSR